MLGIFQDALAHPPPELKSPASDRCKAKGPEDILQTFLASRSAPGAFSVTFPPSASLACAPSPRKRVFCGYDDMYCAFEGSLRNLWALIRQYGLHRGADEAVAVAEAYRTLRDRAPYPADQVLADLDGPFAFLLFDHKARTLFAALGSEGGVGLFWGVGADGSLVLSGEVEVMKAGCGKSFAPFPRGCMFHSERGLMSFEQPMYRLKAMPRVDSEGAMCGANFKVDKFSRIRSMPRVGSQANWTQWISN